MIMDAIKTQSQPLKSSSRWLSILQLILSALAAALLLGASFIITVVNLVQRYIQGAAAADPTQPLMIAASLAFVGILAIPSAWHAWKLITHPAIEPSPSPERRGYAVLLTVLVVGLVLGALLLGNLASKDTRLSWWLLPPLNIIATGLPTLWVIYLGTHGLISGKPARKWGVFISSLIIGPLVILVLELILLVGFGLLALIWIMLKPNLANQLNNLLPHLQAPGVSPEVLLHIMLPLLFNPVILFLVFAYISLVVPMLEEALKPLGVWFLARVKITPAQGFAYGVLCGAGFGLFENLGNTSGGGDTWVVLASARITTLLLHSLNTGLVGWALASAWSQKRYLRLGIVYAYAVLMHGTWNGLAVLSFISSLESLTGISIPANLLQLGNLAAIGIAALGAFNLVFFIVFSNAMRRSVRERGNLLDANIRQEIPQDQTSLSGQGLASSTPDIDKSTSEIKSE